METDTNETIEIAQDTARVITHAAGAALLAGFSGAAALHIIPGAMPDSIRELCLVLGAIFFGLLAILLTYRLFSMGGGRPVVTLSPHGFRDIRLADEFIPWSAIQHVSSLQVRRQTFIVLAVDPAVEARLALTRIARWSRGRSLGTDGLCITAQGIQIEFNALWDKILDYARTRHGS
ncbi:STM3941 family protein [Rhizobium sp. NPDC090279]|uniref:STM3941 family protein n=1 Tax=Rhizobium sp. NPDC090279 TaxID=3364499 RepID=UPI00383B1D88